MSLGSAFAVDLVKVLRSKLISDARELGDVRRNVALFLAKKAGDRRSSFERNLRPLFDVTRLDEVPYLASIGYLVAAGVILNPSVDDLRAALEKAVRRAPHTVERSGYADDPYCTCGLLLLAREVKDEPTAKRIEENLNSLVARDAVTGCVAALTLGKAVHAPLTLDPDSVEQVAAANILHRIDSTLGRKVFPGFPADLQGHLLALLAKQAYSPAADLASMIVLAAIEASVSLSNDEPPAADGRCDLGIIVAIKEEFRSLFERIQDRHTHVEDRGRSYYIFEVASLSGDRPYRCVATLVGDMGPNRTSVVTEKVLTRWDPALVAVVGIAGGIHKDARLGDVIVASEVLNYVEGAKAVDGPSGVAFQRSSDSLKPSASLLNRVRNFEFANRASFQKWQTLCEKRCRDLGTEVDPLRTDEILRAKPVQLEGHVASGPAVVMSNEFVAWIRGGDRSCLCVEMESGGAMIAGHMDHSQRDVIVIRSISDLADDRKPMLDKIGGGVLRQYAMNNALDFLWSLVEAGVLPRGPDNSTRGATSTKAETIKEALLRALREHADANGEVTAGWMEIREWLNGTTADVHAAAIHLKDDGHFRSQMFEGSPDGVCHVVLKQ